MQGTPEALIHIGAAANTGRAPDRRGAPEGDGRSFSESLKDLPVAVFPEVEMPHDAPATGIGLPPAGNEMPLANTIGLSAGIAAGGRDVTAVAEDGQQTGLDPAGRRTGELDGIRLPPGLREPGSLPAAGEPTVRLASVPLAPDSIAAAGRPATAGIGVSEQSVADQRNERQGREPAAVLVPAGGRREGLVSAPPAAVPDRIEQAGDVARPERSGGASPAVQTEPAQVSPASAVNRGRLSAIRFSEQGPAANGRGTADAAHQTTSRVAATGASGQQHVTDGGNAARQATGFDPRREIAFRGQRPAAKASQGAGLADSVREATGHAARDAAPNRPASAVPESRFDLALSATSTQADRRIEADIGASRQPSAVNASVPAPAASQSHVASLPSGQAPVVATAGGSVGAAGPAPAAIAPIDIPVTDTAWPEALHDRVQWLAGRNIQSAEIRLNPADLGPLKVRISVDDNSTSIAFSASHAVTRDVLETALPRLREMLAANGMSLAGASVSEQSVADQRNERQGSEPAAGRSPEDEPALPASEHRPERPPQKTPVGLVDTYA